MSQSSYKQGDSTPNPSTPLSPFPSTPHRLSYIGVHNINDSPIHQFDNTNYATSLTEHISPTKAAATTRLNHEISTLTAWLEGLFDPSGGGDRDRDRNVAGGGGGGGGSGGIPPPLQKWKSEVLSAAQGSFDGPVPLLGCIFNTNEHSSQNQPHTPSRPTQISRNSSTTTNIATNNPVLEELKTLKQVNLSADYLATLLHDARLEELRMLQDQASRIQGQRDERVRARVLLEEVYSCLTPDAVDALRSLSEAAVTLGIDPDRDLDTADGSGSVKDLTALYAQGILGQVNRKFMLEEQVREFEGLSERIRSASASSVLDATDQAASGHDTGDDGRDEHIHAQTAQFNRDTKQINLKIMEYHDRVTSLERQLAGLRTQSASLQDVLNARARVEDRRAKVKALQERFAAFNGLPPDLEDSRNEVRRAMAELESLKRRREGLFERMGTG